jgi:mRNA interferase MazF
MAQRGTPKGVTPNENAQMKKPSQIMVEKILTIPREKISQVIGRLGDEQLVQLNRTLAFVVGLG